MNPKLPALLISSVLLLNACANTGASPSSATQGNPPDARIPYPEPDTQAQINNLGIQMARLEKQIESLQTRVRQLERRAPAARTPARTGSSTAVPAEPARPVASDYDNALKHYHSGNYAAAIALLRGADSGGNGSDDARQRMYLLLQSHQRMGNCESVINIGNRFANRFRNSAQASEALFSVGSCQYRMQQQDIARDTWRKLIQIYPDSPAAKRAYGELKKR
ncbi:tol-pal system YbgF family protein [Neisseria sp.]|uniref:tetratricopeptide repeat protein n=1 Tax=Neisseria sp. TaxID=192066 RepID=UPI0026DA9A6E|nr:tetratricopeptide repeat protein [Neisseria sp.]MDO4226960.1 tetratricopeptide repeat protein [Neisseria sp.]